MPEEDLDDHVSSLIALAVKDHPDPYAVAIAFRDLEDLDGILVSAFPRNLIDPAFLSGKFDHIIIETDLWISPTPSAS